MGEVNPGGLDQAQVVDAAVLEEAPVLNRQNGVDQNLGNVLVGDQLAFGALAGLGKRRDHNRLEFIGGQVTVAASNRVHDATVNLDRRRFWGVVGLRSGRNLNAAGEQLVRAHLRL